jgi:hypothetical protein
MVGRLPSSACCNQEVRACVRLCGRTLYLEHDPEAGFRYKKHLSPRADPYTICRYRMGVNRD